MCTRSSEPEILESTHHLFQTIFNSIRILCNIRIQCFKLFLMAYYIFFPCLCFRYPLQMRHSVKLETQGRVGRCSLYPMTTCLSLKLFNIKKQPSYNSSLLATIWYVFDCCIFRKLPCRRLQVTSCQLCLLISSMQDVKLISIKINFN